MNLDKLQVNASIRSGWQAIDLGFLMARAWWRPLYLASLMPLLPLTIVLLIVFAQSPLWTLLFIWWLKPFWERLPLFIASRMLFDEQPDIWASMKSLPLVDSLPWLLWRRLSVQRAFDNPVTVLEGLKGNQRQQRRRILHGKYGDVALGNQLLCFCFELLVAFGMLILLDFFLPDAFGLVYYDAFDTLTTYGEWMFTLAGIVAMTLVTPFHTMAGFALYLNRRIELEAWDVEISFRNLASRKRRQSTASGSVLVLLVALSACVNLAFVAPADAAQGHDRDSASSLIESILAAEDFGQERTLRKWRFKDWNDEQQQQETFPEWLIDFLEWMEYNLDWAEGISTTAAWLKLILVVMFAGLLLYLFWRFRGPLSRLVRRSQPQAAPQILFGLDVSPESLPDNVPDMVLRLWDEQSYREALGLLYRASLSRLIERHEIAFRASHTEAECAALVKAQGVEALSDYFWQLTQVWRRLAYGHQIPQLETIRSLCDGWNRELSDEPD